MSSRNRSAAVAGLGRQVGRQDDLGLDVQVAVAVGPEAGHALAGQPERLAGLRPGRDREEHPALRRPDVDVRAEQGLAQRQRELAFEVRSAAGEGPVRELADHDVEVAAAGRLAGQADAAPAVGALGDGDLEALAVDLDQAGRAVVRLVERDLGDRLGAGAGWSGGPSPAVGLRAAGTDAAVAVEAHPGEDVVERRAHRSAGVPRPGPASEIGSEAPAKKAWKKSLKSAASPVVWNS